MRQVAHTESPHYKWQEIPKWNASANLPPPREVSGRRELKKISSGRHCTKCLSMYSANLRSSVVTRGAATEQLEAPTHNPPNGVEAILFDMDGVLCNSEELSRSTAVTVLEELYGVKARAEDFIPFAGMGEANFLGGVARKYGKEIDIAATKQRFFEIYLAQAADPDYRIGYPGAVEMVRACREAGLRTAVASSADRVKVDANLKAAGFNAGSDFDAIVSADKFELLKPAPDIFLAAAQALGCPPGKCIVIEDAAAGIQAARAAGALCIGVTTSLSVAEMRAQSPDAVYKQLGEISIANLFSLEKLSVGTTDSVQEDQHKALPTQV